MNNKAIRNAHDQFLSQITNITNLGLWLNKQNRFIDSGSEHDEKDAMLKTLADFKLRGQHLECYQHAFKHWKQVFQQRSSCDIFKVKSTSKILLGLGNASIHEFGVNLNHPWGVPYIPGSALKGVASSYLQKHGGEDWFRDSKSSCKSRLQAEIFGGEFETNGSSYIGNVIFNDAWLEPTEDNLFQLDIINPHHQEYYAEKNHPTGMESPIPVKLAALKAELSFHICLEGPQDQVKLIKDVLISALSETGIGSKTAVGYGRFQHILSKQEQQEKEIKKKKDAEELWENAKISYEIGSATLSATTSDGTAILNGPKAKELFTQLSKSNQKKAKKSQLSQTVVIYKQNNKIELLGFKK